MNTLRRLQHQYAADGEVNLKPGMKTAGLWCLGVMMTLGCVAAGIVQVDTLFAGDYDGVDAASAVVLAVVLLGFGSFLAVGIMRLMQPSVRAQLGMRVTRVGIEMSGLRIPWQSIAAFDTHQVNARGTMKWLRLSLCGNVTDDGSVTGRALAMTINNDRSALLKTSYLNVRHTTLLEFLRQAHAESAAKIRHLAA